MGRTAEEMREITNRSVESGLFKKIQLAAEYGNSSIEIDREWQTDLYDYIICNINNIRNLGYKVRAYQLIGRAIIEW